MKPRTITVPRGLLEQLTNVARDAEHDCKRCASDHSEPYTSYSKCRHWWDIDRDDAVRRASALLDAPEPNREAADAAPA